MKEKSFSLKSVISNSLDAFKGKAKRAIAVSTIQFVVFLLTYFITKSLLLSFVVYSIFLPSQVKFLLDINNNNAEDVFKIGKNLTTFLLISMLFVFVFGVFFILLIFPAVIFFANYALVFDVAKNGDKPVLESFKQAKQISKGYRGKLALLCLAFLLLLILFLGLGIATGLLFSLFLPALRQNTALFFSFLQTPGFYHLGVLLGLGAFLIFVLPLELLSVSKFREDIEADKNPKAEVKEVEEYKSEEPKKKKKSKQKVETGLDDRDEKNPADYIF